MIRLTCRPRRVVTYAPYQLRRESSARKKRQRQAPRHIGITSSRRRRRSPRRQPASPGPQARRTHSARSRPRCQCPDIIVSRGGPCIWRFRPRRSRDIFGDFAAIGAKPLMLHRHRHVRGFLMARIAIIALLPADHQHRHVPQGRAHFGTRSSS